MPGLIDSAFFIPSCRIRQVLLPWKVSCIHYAGFIRSKFIQIKYLSMRKLPNYLRTYRKRAGLTQDEMAYLLGCRSGAKVSRYEHFTRQPNLKTVFAYQIIFHVPAEKLFPGIYHEIEDITLERAKLLSHRLEKGRLSRVTARKIEALNTF